MTTEEAPVAATKAPEASAGDDLVEQLTQALRTQQNASLRRARAERDRLKNQLLDWQGRMVAIRAAATGERSTLDVDGLLDVVERQTEVVAGLLATET
jgi:hypothetical protein